jgi:hypothetical protein
VVAALVGVANRFGFGPFTVLPLLHHSEPFMPGDRTCTGGACTFQIPGPPWPAQDSVAIRCIYAYLQKGTTDGQSAYLVKISRDGSATYPYAIIEFSGDPVPGDVASITISGTTTNHAIGYGDTLQSIVSQMRAALNGTFAGVWADDNFGTSTTLRIQSKAPLWTFPSISVGAPNSVTLTLASNLGTAGDGAAITGESSLNLEASEAAELLLFDLK